MVKKYKENQDEINKERQRIKEREEYYTAIENDFKELVTLPKELKIKVYEETFLIYDSPKKRNLSPAKTLSESEIKRLALVVLKNQIEYANLDYLILDDPIDSYDDYYLKRASKYIAKIINDNENLKWTIFTHVFELVDILNKNVLDSISFENVFYLFDPTYKYNENEMPNLMMKIIKKECVSSITNHEIVIAKKIFSKESYYEMDCDFAILSTIITLRNIVNDILKIYKYSPKESKVDKKMIKIENRYIHYSNFGQVFMKDLFNLTKKVYSDFCFEIEELDKLNEDAVKIRESILKKEYKDIYVFNELLKLILYNMLRVSYCKYLLELKLISRMEKFNYPKRCIVTVFKKNGLGAKLKKVLKYEKDLEIVSDFEEINKVYYEFDSIISDFSHGTIRMFPPYLSINSFDVSKFEKYVEEID